MNSDVITDSQHALNALKIFTADSLIEVFGDEAYSKGVAMSVEAVHARDMATFEALAKALLELMKRGYRK